MPSDWDDYVRNVYRDVVGEADVDGTKLKLAGDEVLSRLIAAVEQDAIRPPDWRLSVPAVIKAVDRGEGQRADRLLREMTELGEAFEWDEDPALPTVVTLGDGNRKAFRHITIEDIESMDQNRYTNMRAASNAYDEFRRKVTQPWSAVLKRHKTIGEAIRNGDYPEWVDPAA